MFPDLCFPTAKKCQWRLRWLGQRRVPILALVSSPSLNPMGQFVLAPPFPKLPAAIIRQRFMYSPRFWLHSSYMGRNGTSSHEPMRLASLHIGNSVIFHSIFLAEMRPFSCCQTEDPTRAMPHHHWMRLPTDSHLR